MGLKNRVVEIAYRLKDQFTGQVGKVTGSFKRVDSAAEKSAKSVSGLGGAFTVMGKKAKVASLAIKATLLGAVISLGAGIVSAITGMSNFRKELDATAKAARSLGETTETMTALQYAADLSGLAMQQLKKGMQQMVRAGSEAAQGTGQAADAIAELGLDARQLEQLRPYEQLKLIAEAMGDIENQSDKVRIAERLFGARNATGFISLMEKGAEGIEQMTRAAKEFGLTYTDEEAAKVERYNDNIATMSARFDGLWKSIKLDLLNRGTSIMDFFDIGVQLEPMQKLNIEIGELSDKIRDLESGKGGFSLIGESTKSQLIYLHSELKRLQDERDELISADTVKRAQARQRAAERDHNRRLSAIRKEGTESLKKTLAERRREYQKNLADLAQLQAQEKQIADEFGKFVTDIQQGEAVGTPDLIDTSKAKLDAQTALNQGDFDGAIEKARQAADMVREMKEAGSESNIVLTGLAKQIERIANESAQGKTKAKEGLIAEQKKQIDEVAKALANLPKAKISIDEDALRAELDRIQKVLDTKPLIVKTKTETVAGYTTQTDLEQQIGDAARQRGSL